MKKSKRTLKIHQHGKLMNKTIKKRKNGDFKVVYENVSASYGIPVQYVYVK